MNQIAVENKMQLGQLLLARGVVTDEQIQQALAEFKRVAKKDGRVLGKSTESHHRYQNKYFENSHLTSPY